MHLPIRNFRIIENFPIATDVIKLVLEPADGEAMFAFKAGQFIALHILNVDGTVWRKSFYSIASAPSESRERFQLAMRIKGEFTRRAAQLKIGGIVGVQGPYGAFVLSESHEPLVLLAGGIGITPLRSMLREALFTQNGREIFLFYSDKTREEMAFLEELENLQSKHANFHAIFMLTREEKWGQVQLSQLLDLTPFFFCRVNAELVRSRVPNMQEAMYFMCGPKEFMQCVRGILESCSVDVKKRLKQELF